VVRKGYGGGYGKKWSGWAHLPPGVMRGLPQPRNPLFLPVETAGRYDDGRENGQAAADPAFDVAQSSRRFDGPVGCVPERRDFRRSMRSWRPNETRSLLAQYAEHKLPAKQDDGHLARHARSRHRCSREEDIRCITFHSADRRPVRAWPSPGIAPKERENKTAWWPPENHAAC